MLFLLDDEGQTLVEYSLILILMAVALLMVFTLVGDTIVKLYTKITDRFNGLFNP